MKAIYQVWKTSSAQLYSSVKSSNYAETIQIFQNYIFGYENTGIQIEQMPK